MIVRIDVEHHITPVEYWQLKRCQVQVDGLFQDVSDAALLRPLRFKTLEESVLHAKKATFTFLEKRRHTEMPDQIDWRVHEDNRVFPCPACHQPLYRKAKLGRFGNTLDLQNWGCPRCKKPVNFNSENLVSTVSACVRSVTPPLPPSEERVISLPCTPFSSTGGDDTPATDTMSPVEMVICSSPFAPNADKAKPGSTSLFHAILYYQMSNCGQ